MKPFRYLPHTADICFQSLGGNFEIALKNAGLAMTNLITDVSKIKKMLKRKISITSPSEEDLVVDALNELIFLLETKGFLMADAKLKYRKLKTGAEISGELFGDNVKNYETHGHVKAATYNDLRLKFGKNRCIIQVVMDV